MGLIKEPKGVDFEVSSKPLKEWEKKIIKDTISHFKKTGQILKTTPLKPRRKQSA